MFAELMYPYCLCPLSNWLVVPIKRPIVMCCEVSACLMNQHRFVCLRQAEDFTRGSILITADCEVVVSAAGHGHRSPCSVCYGLAQSPI